MIGTLGLLGPISQIVPMDESVELGDPARRPRRRRRLLDVLPAAQDGGARRRALQPRHALEFAAATSGHAVLVSGLTVMIAMAGMFLAGNAVFTVVRDRHDPRRRASRCSARSPSSPRCSPSSATRSRRAACRSSAACATATTASRASGAGSSTACSRRPVVALVVAGGILLVLAIPALDMKTINPGVAGPAARPADHADLRPHPGRVPRRPAAGARRGPGRRRHAARGARPASTR